MAKLERTIVFTSKIRGNSFRLSGELFPQPRQPIACQLLLFTILLSLASRAAPPFTSVASAQSRVNQLELGGDLRGAPKLTVCSQNLAQYGTLEQMERKGNLTPEEGKLKERALIKRFVKAKCDVLAVQEVLTSDPVNADVALQQLARALHEVTGRTFATRIGAGTDKVIRTGFLVANDRADILNALSYENVELPKLSEKEKPQQFLRAPLELQIQIKPRGEGSFPKTLSLINIHFKSHRGGAGSSDAAGLEFETTRMQMAEAVRRIVENRHERSFTSGETLLMVLGDRNSNFDTASAKILEGVLTLKQFQEGGTCRLSKRGVPLCQAGSAQPQRLFSVLTTDPESRVLPGTFIHKKVFSWLDEIAMPAESLRFAWQGPDTDGNYASGVVAEPTEASDHALVYVRLSW